MGYIKNFDTLATTPQRKIVLQLIEEALASIKPKEILKNTFLVKDNILTIKKQEFNLNKYKRIFLIGFGKGSGGISKIIESELGDRLTNGFVIDNIEQAFSKIHFTLGSHPLPSEQNITFTEHVLANLKDLRQTDLVLVVICGGGSAMFEAPFAADLTTLTHIFDVLLKSGATISDMNIVRKHLSKVKGGGLAKHLYPATVVSLIFSDVPGSNLSVIASGPTVMEKATIVDVERILKTYAQHLSLPKNIFTTLPTDEKYFTNVSNILIVSNQTALAAMKKKVQEYGYKVSLFSDRAQGLAKILGSKLIEKTKPHTILLAAGETTIKVKGNGKGGRNQTLVLAALQAVGHNITIASFDSDGIDFYHFAGAIGDYKTVQKARQLGLDQKDYLDNDNSYEFFHKTGDGIDTGKLESNISDLMIVLKE